MIKIIGINGSTRQGSTTLKTLKIALNAAKDAGAEIDLIDLREWQLPIYIDDEPHPEIVQRFKEKVQQADGIILASPEYHGTLTGAMKNALDYLSREEIQDKAIGAVATAGSQFGADRTLTALQQIGQKLRGWPVKTAASVQSAYNMFDGDRLKDKRLEERIQNVGQEVVFLAKSLASNKTAV
ncbi:MAG: NAD(P)H-dependent oxidoreductase [Bacillaceae bacterium]|nr:NAD(P)H-dependent oxidoreductase [Bacillaceae bacterium]